MDNPQQYYEKWKKPDEKDYIWFESVYMDFHKEKIDRDIKQVINPVGWSIILYTQNVVGLISNLGIYLGCGFDPLLQCPILEATSLCYVSFWHRCFSFSLTV